MAEMSGIPGPIMRHHVGATGTQKCLPLICFQRLQILICVPVAMSQFNLKFDWFQSLFTCV